MVRSQVLKTYIQRAPHSLKVISFDVFDTILIRMVPSERVTQIAAENLCGLLGKPTLVPMVVNSRHEFVKNIKKVSANGEAEWTVSQWLEAFAQRHELDSQRLLQLGRQAELNAEMDCLRMADEAVEALSLLKQHGLRAIAVSDMWLDQEWLRELLEKFDLFFDEVFSSGTLKRSKTRGTIFKVVEGYMNCGSEAFLHIGDNLKADLLQPRLHGWKSIWLPNDYQHPVKQVVPAKVKRTFLQQTGCQEILQALHVSPAPDSSAPYFRLAYDYLAPLLIILSIVQWRRFLAQDIEMAFYIARDARIMMEVYDAIFDLLPGSCPQRYIRLSRRSVALVHPDNLFQNVIPLAGKVGRRTISEWLSNFTLDDGLRQRILAESGLMEFTPFTPTSRNALRKACQIHLADIEKMQDELRTLIRDYLFQEAKTHRFRKIGIVDSGWACTTQDTLRGVFADAELISGMYFGVSRQGHAPTASNQKYGLLRDDFRNLRHHNPVESSAGVVRLWDTLLREPAGSVRRLERCTDKRVQPILDEGKVIGRLEREAADAIRHGVLLSTRARRKGVALLVKLSDHLDDGDFEKAATAISGKISTYPTRQIADAILRLGFDEGTAQGNSGNLGLSRIKQGVAWYPGILARFRLGWSAPILKYLATVLRWQKNKRLSIS